MSIPVIIRPRAESDIRDSYAYFERIRAGLGTRFMSRLNDLLVRIEFMPKMYGVVWRRVRAARINKFQHIVYYTTNSTSTEVIAVIHGSRDESAWRSRV